MKQGKAVTIFKTSTDGKTKQGLLLAFPFRYPEQKVSIFVFKMIVFS